jgi:hypothetical protein
VKEVVGDFSDECIRKLFLGSQSALTKKAMSINSVCYTYMNLQIKKSTVPTGFFKN